MDYGLRPVRAGDLAAYYRWQEEDPDWELYTSQPVQFVRPYEVYHRQYLESLAQGRETTFSVLADGEVVGRMVAGEVNPRNLSVEIGYYLAPAARGRGLGGWALRGFVAILFRWPGRELHKLWATTAQANAVSAALLRSQGFRLDGRLRDHYRVGPAWSDQLYFSLLRSEWLATLEGRTVPSP